MDSYELINARNEFYDPKSVLFDILHDVIGPLEIFSKKYSDSVTAILEIA